MRITERFEQWLAAAPSPRRLGQVVLLTSAEGHELRHHADLAAAPADLAPIADLAALREVVKTDAAGKFRPLRGAPDLRGGWCMGALGLPALVEALNVLYPGALAFWAGAAAGTLQPTGFSGTARRQTGMYRIVQVITGPQLERTVARVCGANGEGCLRRRLWHSLADEAQAQAPLAPAELPLFCPEACNYFVAQARETILQDREADKAKGS